MHSAVGFTVLIQLCAPADHLMLLSLLYPCARHDSCAHRASRNSGVSQYTCSSQTPLSLLERLRTKGFGVLTGVLRDWKPWIPPESRQVTAILSLPSRLQFTRSVQARPSLAGCACAGLPAGRVSSLRGSACGLVIHRSGVFCPQSTQPIPCFVKPSNGTRCAIFGEPLVCPARRAAGNRGACEA